MGAAPTHCKYERGLRFLSWILQVLRSTVNFSSGTPRSPASVSGLSSGHQTSPYLAIFLYWVGVSLYLILFFRLLSYLSPRVKPLATVNNIPETSSLLTREIPNTKQKKHLKKIRQYCSNADSMLLVHNPPSCSFKRFYTGENKPRRTKFSNLTLSAPGLQKDVSKEQ